MKILRLTPCVAALLCGGCLATNQNIRDLQYQLNSFNSSITQMQKNQAEINSKMDELSRNLRSHSENLKDFDVQLNRLSAKMDDMDSIMSQRMQALGQAITKQQKEDDEQRRAESAAMLPSKIFSESSAHLLKKNYELAAQGFTLYLEKFPSGALVENAYYNLGESYAGLGKWQEAAVAYATLLEKYKSSSFVPAARLKYAQTLLKLPEDHKAEAISYLKSIPQDFPASSQAVLAQNLLKTLQPPAKPSAKEKPASVPAKPAIVPAKSTATARAQRATEK
ncbi:MAG TPA: tetratricopeptide repeat protein [Elusimicrobiales bacterium]|nr:tetratricopeptide repeat protein [Elusimicrobiales bacterium]